MILLWLPNLLEWMFFNECLFDNYHTALKDILHIIYFLTLEYVTEDSGINSYNLTNQQFWSAVIN